MTVDKPVFARGTWRRLKLRDKKEINICFLSVLTFAVNDKR